MKNTTKEAWVGGANISPEALNKRKQINKKIMKFFVVPSFVFLFGVILLGSLVEDNSTDPLKLGETAIEALINKKVPYDKWSEWGQPETLEGTNNKYWIAYLEKANISFVSEKQSDKILFAGFDKNSALEYFDNIEEERTKMLEEQFSAWDGSHINLTRLLKKNLNDPDSYEHVETVYWDRGNYLIVQTKYRAKNGFGAMVLGRVKIKASLTGDILEVLEQE